VTSHITALDSSSAIRSSISAPIVATSIQYVRDLEEVLMRTVGVFGLHGTRVPGPQRSVGWTGGP
jgi:hypothetical protein